MFLNFLRNFQNEIPPSRFTATILVKDYEDDLDFTSIEGRLLINIFLYSQDLS